MMLNSFSHNMKPWRKLIFALVVFSVILVSYQVSLHSFMYQNMLHEVVLEESAIDSEQNASEECHSLDESSLDEFQCQSVTSAEKGILVDDTTSTPNYLTLFGIVIISMISSMSFIHIALSNYQKYFLQRPSYKQISTLQLQLHSFLI